MGLTCCKPEVIDFEGELQLYHFTLMRSIGKGAFGKVRIVQHKNTKAMYALKYINKVKCIQIKAVRNIIEERRMLEQIECPFICNMRYSFQDDEHMFMVLDLMMGGDLRFHLDRMRRMPEAGVRFIVAEMSCALTYLHTHGIIHRDLKPDNILLDEHGHVHLTDFNIAARWTEGTLIHGIAGSMAYMAPEILAKKGYQSAVDWWSLGVIAFELATGSRPFYGASNTALAQAILKHHVIFPKKTADLISTACQSCIQSLLDKTPETRLGTRESGGGITAFRKHPWFASAIDWNLLEIKQASPVFVPDNKRPNFDATYELEEILLEENPLTSQPLISKTGAQVPIESLTGMARELRLVEEQYPVFDRAKAQALAAAAAAAADAASTAAGASAPPHGCPSLGHPASGRASTVKKAAFLHPTVSSPAPPILKSCAIELDERLSQTTAGKIAPGKSEPGKSESGRAEPGRAEPGRTQPDQPRRSVARSPPAGHPPAPLAGQSEPSHPQKSAGPDPALHDAASPAAPDAAALERAALATALPSSALSSARPSRTQI